MRHVFTYVSYETLDKDSKRKLYHHTEVAFDDEAMTFEAKHLGDSSDGKTLVAFESPKDITVPTTAEVRLIPGDENSDVSLPFISALMLAQFKIWVSGKVSSKDDSGLTAEEKDQALSLMDEKDRMKSEIILEFGNAKAKKEVSAKMAKLLGK